MSSHRVSAESKKYASSPKETAFPLVPGSKYAIPLKASLEIAPWTSTDAEEFTTHHLAKNPERDTELQVWVAQVHGFLETPLVPR